LEVYMYDNINLRRAISALEGAGFLITGFSHKPWEGSPMKLKVLPSGKNKLSQEAYLEPPIICKKEKRFPGETVSLERYFGENDWQDAIRRTKEDLTEGNFDALSIGDFILASFDVPAASHKGVDFDALHIQNAKVHIIEIKKDKIVFNFDEVIFRSGINAKDKNTGGFRESALAEYLNAEFLDALKISDLLSPNNDGNKISLPTAFEVFGNEDYWEPVCNFAKGAYQLDFFKGIKNRIKVQDNDTTWWWLSSPSASSAADFCGCDGGGDGGSSSASAVGGVAPVFCVATATPL
jgi:hypothetical protein